MKKATQSLTSKLEKHLTTYVAAATAAGVAMIAASQPAEAKVVYTATNTVIGNGTTLDLNNDGTPDFKFTFNELSKAVVLAVQPDVKGSGAEIQVKGGAAIAGIFGQPVGPGNHFAASASGYGWVFMADAGSYSVTWFFGPWANAKNRFLGFKFEINGQTHYGWARLSVGDYIHQQPVVLTGYAYETTANTKIVEGELTGTADNFAPADLLAPTQPGASLGALARGADAMSLWRRPDEIAAF